MSTFDFETQLAERRRGRNRNLVAGLSNLAMPGPYRHRGLFHKPEVAAGAVAVGQIEFQRPIRGQGDKMLASGFEGDLLLTHRAHAKNKPETRVIPPKETGQKCSITGGKGLCAEELISNDPLLSQDTQYNFRSSWDIVPISILTRTQEQCLTTCFEEARRYRTATSMFVGHFHTKLVHSIEIEIGIRFPFWFVCSEGTVSE